MNYTSIEQSKKLLELGLSPESADMYYLRVLGDTYDDDGEIIPISEDNSVPRVITNCEFFYKKVDMFSCWSLAALLDVLPNGIVMNKDSQTGRYHFSSKYIGTYVTADNPVDACVAMIEKLHKLNL